MFIYIFDDLSIKAFKQVGEDDLRSCSNGYLSIIDISDANNPSEYANGEWVKIEVKQ